MSNGKIRVAWCSYFPVEWLEGAPDVIRQLPKRHPASWLSVGVAELRKIPGLELHVLDLNKNLARDVTFDLENVKFHCLKVPGGIRAPSLFWVDTMALRRRLKQIRPDVLHAWGTEKGASLVASRLPYRYLVSLQGLMEYYSKLVPLNWYERLSTILERLSLRRAKVASGESTFVVDWLRGRYPRMKTHHVEHAPGWTYYEVRREPQVKPIQFVSVGSIGFRKGTDLLIAALDAIRKDVDFRLTLIGVSPQDEFLKDLKQRSSAELWERVTLLSRQRPVDIAGHYARATMVLFPTRADTGPVAVKEAVVAGVPVVGSLMGGIPEYVTPGENGLLFPPGDLTEFVAAIREACSHPLFSYGLVNKSTLTRVREHLSPRRMAAGFFDIYQRLSTVDGSGK